MTLTITNAWICQYKEQRIQTLFGNLIIENGKITRIEPGNFQQFLQQKNTLPKKSPTTFDAGGRVVTVPLVNFHDHLYSRLAKGLPIHGPMDNFVHILETLWWRLDLALDLDMVEACARLGALESIRQGVTYLFDHHASPAATSGSLATIGNVLQQYKLRGVLCFETSDRNGAEKAHQALQENREFIEKYRNEDLLGLLGLHASFTLKDQTLRQAAEIQKELGIGIHIHIAEDIYDVEFSLREYGIPPAQRLEKFGLLTPDSILVHGVHLKDLDLQIIDQSGAALAYNPDSNLNNAVGIPRYIRVPWDIPILSGTDGMHANISRSLKQLFLLYRHQGNSFDEAFGWFQKIYHDQQQFVRRFFPDFPSLQEGDRADLVVWDYFPPTPLNAENFWGHYIYGILEAPAHSVLMKGEFLLKNDQLQVDNIEEAKKNIYRQGERLFKAFEN